MNVIGVVGLGVVGKTVATAFSDAGVQVQSYDRYLGIGSPGELADCAIVFVCVPTPGADDGNHDMTEVWSAIAEAAVHVNPGTLIAIKSTVPPGTCDRLTADFPLLEFVIVPEFLVATRRTETFTRPDRIVIGARSVDAATTIADQMSRVASGAPVLVVRPIEAELIKLCSNAMLAAKVTMANEFANICEILGVAWPRVQAGIGLDRRIGPDHLTVTAERGFGGGCLPKDLDGLIAASRTAGYIPLVLEQIAEFNRQIRRQVEVEAPLELARVHLPARVTAPD